MAKKITAVLLAALMCFAISGCSKDGAPDGMHLVSVDGEPFKLYVPKEWQSNVSSGISGAFFSAGETVAVSARYHTPKNEGTSLEEYADTCVESYAQSLTLFSLLEDSASVLGGADARLLVYTAEVDSEDITYRQYITKYLGDFIILTFRASSKVYEEYTEQYDMIVEAFTLCDKGEVANEEVTDKKTPSGMKIASSDIVEYRLYVPKSWQCDPENGQSDAYYPESGRPNVTVTSYSPDDVMTATEYFDECEKQYEDSLKGYELLSENDRTVASCDAKVYTYRVEYEGMRVRIMQTVLVYNQMVYSITYTAHEDSFDAHMDDVDTILDVFRFR